MGVFLTEEIIIALIGLIGVVSGAALTAIIHYFTAKHKLEKLKIAYTQKSQEKIIESARYHLDDLYLPLYKELSSLNFHYKKYRNAILTENEKDKKGQERVKKSLFSFMNCIQSFDSTVQKTFESGNTAYLIGILEDRLIELSDFLEKSKKGTIGIIEKEITTTIGFSIFGTSVRKTYTKTKEIKLSDVSKKLENIHFSTGLYPTKVEAIKEIRFLKAPLSSKEFEKQFFDYIMDIRNEIKEVTLWMKRKK